ncbi:MAG: hypothetical protein RJA63_125 [Pseudomonadota bacterium]|jgi:hypothetical protein
MFGFGRKKSYEDRIRELLEASQQSEAASVARDAFADKKSGEHVLAWVASSMYERDVIPAFDLLEEFVIRFPDSLHLPRVYLADILSRASQFDKATDLARYYLRLARDSNVLSSLDSRRIEQEGVSRSFLLLTSAYTTLGARSYSKRMLQFGLGYALVDRWREAIKNELLQLERELLQTDEADLDSRWETFFCTGAGAGDLFSKCSDEGFPRMAKRVDLLEGNFRFNGAFQVDVSEAFMLVVESRSSGCVLC